MLFLQHAPMPGPPPGFSPIVTTVAVGLLVVLAMSFVLWALIRANVARAFAKIIAVIAIGAGIGILTWGICAQAMGMPIRTPYGMAHLIADPVEAIGWGAGLLAGGITAMILALTGAKRPPTM